MHEWSVAVSTTEMLQNLALTQGKDASSAVLALAVVAGPHALYADAHPRASGDRNLSRGPGRGKGTRSVHLKVKTILYNFHQGTTF